MPIPDPPANRIPLRERLEQMRQGNAEAANFIALTEIGEILEENLRATVANLPRGYSQKLIYTVTAGYLFLDYANTLPLPLPWKAVTMFNDGPSALYYGLNTAVPDPVPWYPNEPINIELERDGIKTLIFSTSSPANTPAGSPTGGTTTLRLFFIK